MQHIQDQLEWLFMKWNFYQNKKSHLKYFAAKADFFDVLEVLHQNMHIFMQWFVGNVKPKIHLNQYQALLKSLLGFCSAICRIWFNALHILPKLRQTYLIILLLRYALKSSQLRKET